MAASFYGHVEIVRMLIEAKAKVDSQDKVHFQAVSTTTTQIAQHIIAHRDSVYLSSTE